MKTSTSVCALVLAAHTSPARCFAPMIPILSTGVRQSYRACSASSPVPASHPSSVWGRRGGVRRAQMPRMSSDIESPFATPQVARNDKDGNEDDLLPLTPKNVESVLDEMRPYLMADGGNVRLVDIDGPAVRLELQGACGSCSSSVTTMKMGLEKRLMQRIPEISEVVQFVPAGPVLNEEEVEEVLDGVRPFLSIADGTITLISLANANSLQPLVTLEMTGDSASMQSVRMEITQRLQRNFKKPTLRVEFVD